MTDLEKLIDAVERGDVGLGVGGITRAMGMSSACGIKDWSLVWKSYHGSIDAAKALMGALLPGISCSLSTEAKLAVVYGKGIDGKVSATSSDTARAWLLAILKAYRNLNA